MFDHLEFIYTPPSAAHLLQIINFRVYQALPKFRQHFANPALLNNQMRDNSTIAWHSKFRTIFPHTLGFRMLRAITKNDTLQVKKILNNSKFDINYDIVDKKYGMNALMYATLLNRFNIMQLLILHGANINKGDNHGNTSLMIAVVQQNLEAINTLMKNGCNRYLKNKYGLSAIQKAQNNYKSPHIYNFVKDYPQTSRKFPNFKIQLEMNLRHPMWDFIDSYKIYNKKAKIYPFNDYKGNYRIDLTQYKKVSQIIELKQQIKNQLKIQKKN